MSNDILARCPLFSVLGADGRAGVAAAARAVDLARNDVLFAEGDPAAAVYVVVSGRVGILKRAGESARESLVALMEAGDVFGEMGLFDGGGRSAQARALEACTLLEVPYPVLRRALEARPEALWDVLALLAGRIRATDETLADAMLLDVPGRTAKRLLELAGPGDGSGPAITQEELAAMVGASRERVNKAIAGFVRRGWVEWSGRRYRVLDRERLAERAR
jgi:CRP/FNR family cyclic AMP-dependent transcriptional regulator